MEREERGRLNALDADNRCLSNSRVVNESRLDLSSRETVTRNVDNVVNTSLDPDITVFVNEGAVTSEVVALVGSKVGVEETVVVAVDRTGDGGERVLDGKDTLSWLAVELESLARGGVKENRLDTEERQSG